MDFHSQPPLVILQAPEQSAVEKKIRLLQNEMNNGMSYLVNFCSQTAVSTNYSIGQLFSASRAPYTIWLENQFIAFSPEPFITVMENQISTNPMKGTAWDADALLADEKEQAEHATVVDLLRNDLSQVAHAVKIDEYRYLTAIPQADGRTLYQTSSSIRGTMPDNWRETLGDWLMRLLPAGSISGAPKHQTVALIRRFEAEPRGFFTGVAFLFDGKNLFSTVLIRYLDLSGPQLKFRSGAGITIYSDPGQEYAEILSKVYIPV